MERSDPIHWTLFIWIGPVPEKGRRTSGRFKDNVDNNKAGKYGSQKSMDITEGQYLLCLVLGHPKTQRH